MSVLNVKINYLFEIKPDDASAMTSFSQSEIAKILSAQIISGMGTWGVLIRIDAKNSCGVCGPQKCPHILRSDHRELVNSKKS